LLIKYNKSYIRNLLKENLCKQLPSLVLAIYLLIEKHNSESSWNAYIKILPTEFDNHFYYSLEDLSQLNGTLIINDIIKSYLMMARQYAYLYDIVKRDHLMLITTFTYEEFLWAMSVVQSRQNLLKLGDKPGEYDIGLIPVWDLFNHANGEISTSFDGNNLEFIAMQDFNIGEQVYMHYGQRNNSQLFLNYGFVYPENQYKYILLSPTLNHLDILVTKKIELLKLRKFIDQSKFTIYMPITEISDDLAYYLKIYYLQENDINNFSPESWKPNLDETKKLLSIKCKELLQTYPTTIEEDQKLLTEVSPRSKFYTCLLLRIEEKLILQYYINGANLVSNINLSTGDLPQLQAVIKPKKRKRKRKRNKMFKTQQL